MSEPKSDLTIVYYTANEISDHFAMNTRFQLLRAAGYDAKIISVSKQPMNLGKNIVVDSPRSHINIYRQALIGAKGAKTKYIALCEDDVLYSPKHFDYRPSPGKFAYNYGYWNIYTWKPELYSWKGRKNLGQLICERDLFIEAMEERFAAHPDDSKIDLGVWAEPGKYERQLGVTIRETEEFYTNPPNIAFSHESALSFAGLGTRKRLGELRATDLPYWGKAEELAKIYRSE